LKPVRRVLHQLVLFAFALAYIVGPVFEHFDRWDHFPQSGHDTVLTIAAIAIILGLGVLLLRFSMSTWRTAWASVPCDAMDGPSPSSLPQILPCLQAPPALLRI